MNSKYVLICIFYYKKPSYKGVLLLYFNYRHQSFDNRRSPYIHPQSSTQYGQYPFSPTINHPTPYEVYAKPPQPLQLTTGNLQSSQNSTSPQGILGIFTDPNGQVDFDKAMTTINQLASTYHQISPIVKEFSSILKAFR